MCLTGVVTRWTTGRTSFRTVFTGLRGSGGRCTDDGSEGSPGRGAVEGALGAGALWETAGAVTLT